MSTYVTRIVLIRKPGWSIAGRGGQVYIPGPGREIKTGDQSFAIREDRANRRWTQLPSGIRLPKSRREGQHACYGTTNVLVFKHIQLLGEWTRSGFAWIIYTAKRRASLLVVAEDETGAKTTYWFKIDVDQEVWVIEDVVHIPAVCLKSASGDNTTCRG